jgi:hypothetical protein
MISQIMIGWQYANDEQIMHRFGGVNLRAVPSRQRRLSRSYAFLYPVFQPQSLHAGKLARVVAHQHRV